jgi:hypothetical protein
MLNLVLGYKSRDKSAKPEMLYLGTDGEAARDALNNPPEGTLRTMLSFPQPHKYRYFQSEEEVARAEQVKAEAEKATAESEKSDKSPTKKQAKKSSQ